VNQYRLAGLDPHRYPAQNQVNAKAFGKAARFNWR
jgi:hypothetical protein